MIKLTGIFLFLIISFYGCASSTRFPSRHSDDKTSEDEIGNRYDKNPPVNDYSDVLESRVGVASYYSDKFQGKKTANGEVFDQDKLTAAHPTYSFGTVVRVKNISNRKTVIVRINDRKPDFNGRIIDLSKKAAEELDMITSGIAKVQVDVLKWGNEK
jgi:rare lipoprotein A (peptidoglycan hydrolase)